MRMLRKQRRAVARRARTQKQVRRVLKQGAGLAAAGILLVNSLYPAAVVQAMPTGGQVAAGAATVNQAGNVMNVNQQSDKAVINWQAFNIAAGERVNFNQPNASAAILNRVIGNNPSAIYGQLTANGRVFLVNQSGVYFAPGSQISVGSLVASALNISTADFMSGRYAFINDGGAQQVINKGKITAANKGLVALLAPEARNEGIIVAKKGTAAIAAGNQATLDFNGDGKVTIVPGGAALQAAAENKGLIEADGGLVLMTAAAGRNLTSAVVNQAGVIHARSLDGQAGEVKIDAAKGAANITGTIDAASDVGHGGTIAVSGGTITAASGSSIDASGANGGGTVCVGGDWQGSGVLPHARNTIVGKDAVIKADATENGNGGKVIIWSDGKTQFDGTISARAAGTGDGGKVETSGHSLVITGNVDASAKNGRSGEWLLDPDAITIDKAMAASISNALKNTNVTEEATAGDITLNDGVTITTAAGNSEATLLLSASDNILINGSIDAANGKLNIDMHADSDGRSGGMIQLGSNSGTTIIKTNGGNILLHGGKDAAAGYASSTSGESAGITLNNATLDATDSTNTAGGITLYGATTSTDSTANGIDIINSALKAKTVSINAADQGTAGRTGLNFTGGSIQAYKAAIATDKAVFGADSSIKGYEANASADSEIVFKTLTQGKDISIDGTAALNYDSGKITGFAAAIIGDARTGTVSVGTGLNGLPNMTLEGSKLDLSNDISVGAGNGSLILKVDGTLVGTGKIAAGTLDIEGAGKAITLNNVGNAVNTLKGTTGDLVFVNADGFKTGKLSTGTASLTGKGSGTIEVTDALTTTGALTVENEGGSVKLDANRTIAAGGDAKIVAKSVTAEATALLAAGKNDIKLQADSFSLEAGTLQGKGTLTLDTLTKANSIGIGAGAEGTTTLAGTAFAQDGFTQLVIGSANDTGAVQLGDLTVNDPLKVEANAEISIVGNVVSNDNNIDVIADAANAKFRIAADKSIKAGTADISIVADGLSFGTGAFGTAAADNSGTLVLTPKSVKDIIIGGTESTNYLLGTDFGNLNTSFKNVRVANAANKITLGALTAKDSYITLQTSGEISVAGQADVGTLVLAGNIVTEEPTGAVQADKLLLLGGTTVTLDKDNAIDIVAAKDVSGLTLNDDVSLTVGSIDNLNVSPKETVAGITAGTVKLVEKSAEANKAYVLALANDINATGNVTLAADDFVTGSGKVASAANLQIFPRTVTRTINVSDTASAGNLNIASSIISGKYTKLILGELKITGDADNQTGNVLINKMTFPSNVEIRTARDSNDTNGAVEFSGTNSLSGHDLTITAHTAKLPASTDTLTVNNLILNLDGGLDIGPGKVTGKGTLTIGGFGTGQNIDFTDGVADEGAYKIAYSTVNGGLSGFSDMGVTGGANVYFDAGSLTSSLKVSGKTGVQIRKSLTISGKDTKVDLSSSNGAFAFADNAVLTVDGTGNPDVSLQGQTVNVGKSAGLTIGTKAAAANVSLQGGTVTLTDNTSVIDLGSCTGNTLNIVTDNLDVANARAEGSNFKGNGNLNIQRATIGNTITLGDNVTSSSGNLAINVSDLNGTVFDTGFTSLTVGNTDGTGTITVNSTTPFNNNLTILNGAGGKIQLEGNNSVAENKAVTLKAGTIANGGTGTLSVGTAGTVNLYTDNLDSLTGNNSIIGTGTLGLASYAGSAEIYLGGTQTEQSALNLTDDKFAHDTTSGVFGKEFSAYHIGNSSQQSIRVNGASLYKDTTLTAQNITFDGNMDMKTSGTALTIAASNKATEAAAAVITTDKLLATGGSYALTGANAIGTLAAKANSVTVSEAAGKTLTVGTVDTTSGVTALNKGDIAIVSDKLVLNEALAGSGQLIIKQASADGTLGIGTNSSGDLNLADEVFNGVKLKDGFSHVYLGNGTGAVDIQGNPVFVDDTTISGSTVKVGNDTTASSLTTNDSSLEFITTTLTAANKSSINTGSGNLTFAADNLNLSGTDKGNIIGSGTLTLHTATTNRDIYLGQTKSGDGLFLQSGYFDGSNNVSRVFADGYKKIIIGKAENTGTLYQTGTTNFSDEVEIVQASKSATGGYNITGTINTNNNPFTVESRSVIIKDATVNAGTGNVSFATDTITVSDTIGNHSTITSMGALQIDTYDTTGINLGEGTTGGLLLKKDWFTDAATSLFQSGYSTVTIGGAHNSGITVGSIDFSKTTTGNVNITTTGNVTSTTTGGIKTSTTSVVNINGGTGTAVTLTGSGNDITNIGNVTGTAISLTNTPTGRVTNITGKVIGTGAVTVDTTGSVNVGTDGQVKSASGDIKLDARGGSFTTSSTASDVINVSSKKQWNIYTYDSVGNTYGNLDITGKRYGTEYNSTTPTDYGKHVVGFELRPEVTVYAENVYGEDFSDFWRQEKQSSIRWEVNGISGNSNNDARAAADADDLSVIKSKATTGDTSLYGWAGLFNTDTTHNSGKTAATNATADGTLKNGAAYYGTDDKGMTGQAANSVTVATSKALNPLNYKVNVKLLVRQKQVTVTAASGERTYDGTAFSGSAGALGYSGFANGETLATAVGRTGDVVYGGSSQGAIHASETPYVIDIAVGSNLAANDYVFTYKNGTLKVNPRQVTILADNGTKVYGQDNPADLNAAITGGTTLAAGDELGLVTVAASAEKYSHITDAGHSYTTAVSDVSLKTGSVGLLSDYSFTKQQGVFTITPRPVIITAGDKTRAYGEANSTAQYAAGQQKYVVAASTDVSGLVNGDTFTDVTENLAPAANANAGSYQGAVTISDGVFSGDDAANYNVTYKAANLQIIPRKVLITAGSAERYYGDANAAVTAFTAEIGTSGSGRGLLGSDSITGVAETYGTAYTEKTHVGNYAGAISVTAGSEAFSGGAAGNYSFEYAPGALKVNARPITIRANDASRVYGADNPVGIGYTIVGGTLVNGDAIGSATTVADATKASSISTAGHTYKTSVSGIKLATGSNGYDTDYAVTAVDGVFIITPRPVTITAGDKTRVYGEENTAAVYVPGSGKFQTAAATADTGLVNGDAIGDVTETINSTAADYAGTTHAITIADASFAAGSSANYAIFYNPGTLTITKRPVTITAGNTSRIYGEANPVFNGFTAETGSVGSGRGLLGSDSLTAVADSYDSAVDAKAHTGNHIGVITVVDGSEQFSGSAKDNYSFDYKAGNLTITARPVDVTIGNASREYGAPEPVVHSFTVETGASGSGRGFVNGEGLDKLTAYVDGAKVTVYSAANKTYSGALDSADYSFMPGVNAGDYSVNLIAGDLVITPAPLIITADDKRRAQNMPNPELTVHYDGFRNGEDASIVSGLTVTTPATQASQAGKYAIAPGQATADNYVIKYVDGVLTVYAAGAADDVHTVTRPQTPDGTKPSMPGTAVPAIPANPADTNAGTAAVPPVNAAMPDAPMPDGIKGDVIVQIGGAEVQRSFKTENGGFALVIGNHGDAGRAGLSSTTGAVPVLYTDGSDQKLDGIYVINYDADKLSILPAAQKVTIPKVSDIMPEGNKDFSITYKNAATGSFDVSFGNGIIAITPLDEQALATVTGKDKEKSKAVIATGVLTAVQDLGIMPDQVRAVYIFTTK